MINKEKNCFFEINNLQSYGYSGILRLKRKRTGVATDPFEGKFPSVLTLCLLLIYWSSG